MRVFGSWRAPAVVALQAIALLPGTASAQGSWTTPTPSGADGGAGASGGANAGGGAYAGALSGPERTLGLAEVERAALEHQAQLAVSRASTATAQAEKEQARSPLLPQVTA